jgi:hypothetical protein
MSNTEQSESLLNKILYRRRIEHRQCNLGFLAIPPNGVPNMPVEPSTLRSVHCIEATFPVDTINSSVDPAAIQYDGHGPASRRAILAANDDSKLAAHSGDFNGMPKTPIVGIHAISNLFHGKGQMFFGRKDALLWTEPFFGAVRGQ